MSKTWRGKNNIPNKIPQKLYIKYKNPNNSLYVNYISSIISSVPINIINLDSYERYHPGEISKIKTYKDNFDFLLRIKQLPWVPINNYSYDKCYPIYKVYSNLRVQKSQLFDKLFLCQQIFRNEYWYCGGIDLNHRKLGDIINPLSDEMVSVKEICRKSLLHDFYDNFKTRFSEFIEDWCYNFFTDYNKYRRVVLDRYWIIKIMLSSMYLIPKKW